MNGLKVAFRGEGLHADGGVMDFYRVSADVNAETVPVAYGDDSRVFVKTLTFSITVRNGLIYPVIETTQRVINTTWFATVNDLTFKQMGVKQLERLIAKLDSTTRAYTLESFRGLLAEHLTDAMLADAKINARERANTTPAIKAARESAAYIEIA